MAARARPPRARRAAAEARRARRAAVTDTRRRHGGRGRLPRRAPALGGRDASSAPPPRLSGAVVDERRGAARELAYLDDRAFAAAWVESRDRARPAGRAWRSDGSSAQGRDARRRATSALAERASGRHAAAADAQSTTEADLAAAPRLLAQREPAPCARARPPTPAAEGLRAPRPLRLRRRTSAAGHARGRRRRCRAARGGRLTRRPVRQAIEADGLDAAFDALDDARVGCPS